MKAKKFLSLFLSLLMALTMIPQTAFATELQPEASAPVCACAELPLCAEGALNDCALCAADASACLGKTAASDPAPDGAPAPAGDPAPAPEAAAKLVTAWTWIDENELVTDGGVGLPLDSVAWDELAPMLPALSATVDGAEETLPLDWSCADVAEGLLAAGVHTLTATLPAGYALSQGVDALTLTLEMGGGEAFASDANTQLYVNGEEVTGTTDKTTTDGWAYDFDTNTLTLNGFSKNYTGSVLSVIGYRDRSLDQSNPLTINLTGDNTITTTSLYGIGKITQDCAGGFVFTGDGTLTIRGATEYAIYASNAALKVGDSENAFTGTLDVSGVRGGLYSISSMELLGGTVIATGTSGSGIETMSRVITIKNNCSVTAEGMECGIKTSMDGAQITIENSTVSAKGFEGHGVYMGEGNFGDNSVLNVTSGELTASGIEGAVGFARPSATLNLPATAYRWRMAEGDEYTQSSDSEYTYDADHIYVEITTVPAASAHVCTNGAFNTEWTADMVTVGSGTYYLDEDVEATGDITINGDVKLCLNNHTLHMSRLADKKADVANFTIKVAENATLTICDCSGNDTGAINGVNWYQTNTALIENNKGTVIMLGGTLEMRRGICIQNKAGKVMLNGGKIWKEYRQGAAAIRNEKVDGTVGGTVTLKDVTVHVQDLSYNFGPAVNNSDGKFVIQEGTVIKGTVSNSAEMHISGGDLHLPSGISMTDNYTEDCVLYLSNNPSFTITPPEGSSLSPTHISQSGDTTIYAYSKDDGSPYTGEKLIIPPYGKKADDVIVYGVTEENKDSFTLPQSESYVEYGFVVNEENNLVLKDLHEHVWTYKAEGNLIFAYCKGGEMCQSWRTKNNPRG